MSSQVPVYSLTTPSQHPVIAIVGEDGLTGVVTSVNGATGAVDLSGTYADVTGGIRKITGPTLPALSAGTKYVWEKTDATTGDLVDIVTGVA